MNSTDPEGGRVGKLRPVEAVCSAVVTTILPGKCQCCTRNHECVAAQRIDQRQSINVPRRRKIGPLHAVITTLLHACLNIHDKLISLDFSPQNI
jgi:hypothetical protein